MNKRFEKEVNSVNYKVTGGILTANQNLLNNFNKIKSFYISPFLVQNEILYIYFLVRISLNSTGNKPTAAAWGREDGNKRSYLNESKLSPSPK